MDRTIAKWLEIDEQMKLRKEFYFGWYCPKCNRMLGKKGGVDSRLCAQIQNPPHK
ncbi:MAG: hypothetical protein O6918_02970 [Deltaproteobacteria bacterium]|nr:hypothetical protein [Deltaproteobacteria bacterium]